jgi:methylmalonyl-CoA mutase C-terminal domain/subunit
MGAEGKVPRTLQGRAWPPTLRIMEGRVRRARPSRMGLTVCQRLVSGSVKRPYRVVVAKPGLDGHDRGAKVIARALRDGGMEVIYTGLRQTPEMIAEAALQEDVEVVGLSILSGAHMALVPRVLELLRANGLENVRLFVGGIIPDEDAAALKAMGVTGVYGPGASMDTVVQDVRASVSGPA